MKYLKYALLALLMFSMLAVAGEGGAATVLLSVL